jgi:hypothetical protein
MMTTEGGAPPRGTFGGKVFCSVGLRVDLWQSVGAVSGGGAGTPAGIGRAFSPWGCGGPVPRPSCPNEQVRSPGTPFGLGCDVVGPLALEDVRCGGGGCFWNCL